MALKEAMPGTHEQKPQKNRKKLFTILGSSAAGLVLFTSAFIAGKGSAEAGPRPTPQPTAVEAVDPITEPSPSASVSQPENSPSALPDSSNIPTGPLGNRERNVFEIERDFGPTLLDALEGSKDDTPEEIAERLFKGMMLTVNRTTEDGGVQQVVDMKDLLMYGPESDPSTINLLKQRIDLINTEREVLYSTEGQDDDALGVTWDINGKVLSASKMTGQTTREPEEFENSIELTVAVNEGNFNGDGSANGLVTRYEGARWENDTWIIDARLKQVATPEGKLSRMWIIKDIQSLNETTDLTG